eukprot:TRINITY_DN11774_c0_g1_i2.p1 TRINITY_DN11774_c0_g1~~TRINITY_DN11774_c0_g1_i2.p1  ORF type:complete len:345 (+),score=83.53 TRINITY_DN11774_c0_g1_i2:128-1162(+)
MRRSTFNGRNLAVAIGLALVAFTALSSFSSASGSRSHHLATPLSLKFIVIGDFGSGTVRGKEHEQHAVARQLATTAAEFQPDFVMTTGDIIYKDGIKTSADVQLRTKFEDVYAADSLQVPWHIIPGNHDCHGSLDAMVEYASFPSNRWDMPARYYVKEFALETGDKVRMLYLDTCLLVCGSMKNFRCEESMRPNLSIKAKQAQLEWLERELAVDSKWKFVVGHWGVFSTTGNGPTPELVDELLPLMQKHNVDVYFNGHDHSLQHLVLKQPKSGPHFVISGAGGYEAHPELKRAAAGYLNRQINPVFRKAVHGFVTAELSAEELQLKFLDTNGGVLYQTEIEARR